MSNRFFPHSSRAIPDTNAERSATQANARAQPPNPQPGNYLPFGFVEDPEDEPGEEMGREARVWKTYVREADRWDKEMIEMRNSSLDVLLIFAALFAAISTAFIIESLSDLKPDYAESSAQTLLVISQTLAVMSSGQTVPLPAQYPPDSTEFSPPHTAVVVNVLWLTSLSLSVAVSLMAMLAKGWCYKFMSGRSGPVYEQGRRRQEKWNGIEWWKMQEALECLPGLMHIALLLFAVGLSIYLRQVHLTVAVPVTVITGVAAFCYVQATLLPMFSKLCPYDTPATAPLLWCMTRMRVWISADQEQQRADDSSTVPMDETTAQMISWMVAYCDDSRSVDVALQAISGASPHLPCGSLVECKAHIQIISRLSPDVILSPQGYRDPSPAVLLSTLRYIRSLSRVTSHVMDTLLSGDEAADKSLSLCNRLLDPRYFGVWVQDVQGQEEYGKPILLATDAWMKLPWFDLRDRWAKELMRLRGQATGWQFVAYLMPYVKALDSTQGTDRGSYPAITHIFAECSLTDRQRYRWLLTPLTHLSVAAEDLQLPCAVAVLAVAAFAINSYPNDTLSPRDESARSDRATRVLQHYLGWFGHLNPSSLAPLFAFCFVGLLPYLNLVAQPEDAAIKRNALHTLFKGINGSHFRPVNGEKIYTLPPTYSLDDHVNLVASGYLTQYEATEDAPTQIIPMFSILAVIRDRLRLDLTSAELYAPALGTLVCAQSEQLQELCLGILESQSVVLDSQQGAPDPQSVVLDVGQVAPDSSVREEREQQCSNLCREPASASPRVFSAVVFYFRVFVANMLLSTSYSMEGRTCTAYPIPDRQAIIESIMSSLNDLGPSDDLQLTAMPTDPESICSHVNEDIEGQSGADCMRSTKGLIKAVDALNTQTGRTKPAADFDWRARLQEIRSARRPAVGANGPSSERSAAQPALDNQDLLSNGPWIARLRVYSQDHED